jgi:hypothetical protein
MIQIQKNCFNIINEYIINGGIFAGFGGLQFFYAWDVNPNAEIRSLPISAKHLLIPTQLENRLIMGFRKILEFSGTLMWNEFDVQTTSDTSVHNGPQMLHVRQDTRDIQQFGDLLQIGGNNMITEYRSVLTNTNNIIPILRARYDDYNKLFQSLSGREM